MKKFFVVVEICSNFENISRCIDSIINQSYSNFEVLVINPYDDERINCLLSSYEIRDKRVRVLEDYSLSSIHDIRMCGFSNCNSDYISFIKSDDYISCDYFRLIYESIEQYHSDINISNYINDHDGYRFVYPFISSFKEKNLDSKVVLNDFFESCGSNNRLYKIELKCIGCSNIKKILDFYKDFNSTSEIEDDIILSTILYSCSKTVSYVNSSEYFINYSKFDNNVKYDLLKRYMSKNSLKKYINYLDNWNVNYDAFYSSRYEYNDGLEKIKKSIIDKKIDIVSFDMFDTLVFRPFYQSSDLFDLLDKEFIKLSGANSVIKFSKIRKDTEAILRKENFLNGVEEVRIDDIYKHIQKFYSVPNSVIKKIQFLEEKLELKFCYKRQTGYELYKLAKFLNKRVVVITDMYLKRETIDAILKNNDYDFDEVYLSSELLKTKNNGSLFKYVKAKEKKELLHIGDSLHSDIQMAKKNNIVAAYLPRAIDVFMGNTDINTNRCGKLYEEFDMYNINVNAYLKISGVRSSLALIANKYFDNPFKTFIEKSKFNSDPFFIGYYSLGMHLFALSKWILSDSGTKGYDSISFMSRDGYLPFKASKLLQQHTNINKSAILNYIFISRKAVIPLLFSSRNSINIFQTYIDYELITPMKLYDILKCVLKDFDEKKVKKIFEKNNIDFTCFKTKDEFFNCLSIIYNNFFDERKYSDYFKLVKTYFKENFIGAAATFDIGYSGKPEALISYMLEKPISTYFFHITSSEAYSNSYLSSYELNTFYDFMPTLTGTVRELFYSDTVPSCIGYTRKNNQIVPIFDLPEKYTYFNKKIIEVIQNSALEFVRDYSIIFSDYIDYFDLNRFYMSIPFEYFNHYIQDADRHIFKDLFFESNINDSKLFTDYIDGILEDYRYFNEKRVETVINDNYDIFKEFLFDKVKTNMYDELKCEIRQDIAEDIKNELLKCGYTSLPKKKLARIIYYILFDNKKIMEKIKRRLKK